MAKRNKVAHAGEAPRKAARLSKPSKKPENRAQGRRPAQKPTESKANTKRAAPAAEPRQPRAPARTPRDTMPIMRPTQHQAEEADVSDPPSSMRIVVGSYERLLYGLLCHVTSDASGTKVDIEPQFVFPAHVSSIRTVACAGERSKWLVSGGTDETIKLWDMRRRVEVGALVGHEGTITSLSFPSRTILLSTSEDGTINLYRTRDWSLLRTLRGHTGRINDACAHPSGRVALSVGADKTIRMWDLMRGVGSASVKIGIEADLIRWDSTGKRFIVLAQRQAMLFSTDMTKLAEIERRERVHDAWFVTSDVGGEKCEYLFVATESAIVAIYDMDHLPSPADVDDAVAAPVELARLVGHKNRCGVTFLRRLTHRVRSVRAMHVHTEEGEKRVMATTISSDGYIRVFDATAAVAERRANVLEINPIAEYNTKGYRLTCLSVVGASDKDATAGDASIADAEPIDATLSDLGDVDDELEDASDDLVDDEEELARLEEQVRLAREAGLTFDDDDMDSDDEDSDERDDHDTDQFAHESEAELEDEAEEA